MCSPNKFCTELKLQFYRSPEGILTKATGLMERIGVDFKGSPPMATRNPYLLLIVNENSR